MSEICSKFLTKTIKKVIHIVLVSLTLVLKSHLILLASLLQTFSPVGRGKSSHSDGFQKTAEATGLEKK